MTNRGTTINMLASFVVEDCITCATLFAMTAELRARRLDDHKPFYCPNGHSMSYAGKTAEQKACERADAAEREAQRLRDRLVQANEAKQSVEYSLRTTKGALTKARKRADNGVCQHCHRHFPDVAAHVKEKHAELVKS